LEELVVEGGRHPHAVAPLQHVHLHLVPLRQLNSHEAQVVRLLDFDVHVEAVGPGGAGRFRVHGELVLVEVVHGERVAARRVRVVAGLPRVEHQGANVEELGQRSRANDALGRVVVARRGAVARQFDSEHHGRVAVELNGRFGVDHVFVGRVSVFKVKVNWFTAVEVHGQR